MHLSQKNEHQVYEPSDDSFLLEESKDFWTKPSNKNTSALEMFCGTGYAGISFAKKHNIPITFVDINPYALEVCEKNCKQNNIQAKFVLSDLFSAINQKFDVILANPPYLPDEPETLNSKDIALDGGEQGRQITNKFLDQAPNFLNQNGTLFLIESSLQHPEIFHKKMQKKGFNFTILKQQHFFFETLFLTKYFR